MLGKSMISDLFIPDITGKKYQLSFTFNIHVQKHELEPALQNQVQCQDGNFLSYLYQLWKAHDIISEGRRRKKNHQ